MRKILTTLIAVAAIGATALATASTADARWGYGWRGGWGWGPGPFIGGAIVGGALAAGAYGAYYYPYGYYTTPTVRIPITGPAAAASGTAMLGSAPATEQAAGFTAKIVPPVRGDALISVRYDFSHQTSAK